MGKLRTEKSYNSNKHVRYSVRFVVILLTIFLQVGFNIFFAYTLGQHFWVVDLIFGLMGAFLFLNIANDRSAAVYKLPWMMLFLVSPLAGTVIYVLFGSRKASRREVETINAPLLPGQKSQKEEAAFATLACRTEKWGGVFRYLRQAACLPLSDCTDVQYLPTGEDFHAALLSALRGARQYILLEYFIIEDGVMWGSIYDVLVQKAQQGIPVYILYDDVGSIGKVPRHFDAELRRAGLQARKFRRFSPVVSIRHNNRDHRKITVVDGETGFLGGVNLADEYINVKRPFGRWLDNGVCLRGEGVESLVRLFVGMYNASGQPALALAPLLPSAHTAYPGGGYLLSFGDSPAPIDQDNIGENLYLDLIDRADRYLYITTPYFIVDTNITEALKRCARRGVDVRLIIPQIPDKKVIYLLTRYYCADLLEAGVKIYAYRDGFLHAKTFLADDEVAAVGTINLDYRSFIHHFECGALLYATPCLGAMRMHFEQLFSRECVPLGQEELSLRLYERLLCSLLVVLAPLL